MGKYKKNVYLIRYFSTDQGCPGLWTTTGFRCNSIELPWRDNKQKFSCIPPGNYECVLYNSKKYKDVYHVKDVEGRTWILTHSGNWAGDTEKGFRTDSHGCILLGKYHANINGQMAVALSRATIRRFVNHMNREPFNLEVIWMLGSY